MSNVHRLVEGPKTVFVVTDSIIVRDFRTDVY